MRVPRFLTINRYHSVITDFKTAQQRTEKSDEAITEAVKKLRYVENDPLQTDKQLKRAKEELQKALSYKITRLKSQRKACAKFIEKLESRHKNKQHTPQYVRFVEEIGVAGQKLNEYIAKIEEQKEYLKNATADKGFFDLAQEQDAIEDEFKTLSNAIMETSAKLSRKTRPLVTFSTGILAISSALYFAGAVAPTIDELFAEKPQAPVVQNEAKQVTEKAVQQEKPQERVAAEPEFIPLDSITQNGIWHRFTCKNMLMGQVIDEWNKLQQHDQYLPIESNQISEQNGIIYLVVKVKEKEVVQAPIRNPIRLINRENKKVAELLAKGIISEEFCVAVEKMSDRLDMNAMACLAIMHFETGGSFSPKQYSKSKNNIGLIQFTKSNAKFLGTTFEKLANMSQIEQLTYVEKHFKLLRRNNADYKIPENVALAVFHPAATGNLNYVVGSNLPGASDRQKKVYAVNKNLDKKLGNNDGVLHAREYVANVMKLGYL